jgi:hypothetical protein
MIAHNKRFNDIPIYLDGCTFVGCTFERCRFIFSGLIAHHLEGNTFGEGCTWEFAGPASLVVKFMSAMYQGGAKDMIEKTFDNIRGDANGAPNVGNAIRLN